MIKLLVKNKKGERVSYCSDDLFGLVYFVFLAGRNFVKYLL